MTHMVTGISGLTRRSGDSEDRTTAMGTEVKILFNYYSLIGIL